MNLTQNQTYDELIHYLKDNQSHFYRLAYSYTRNQEDALDIVQNAVCRSLEKYPDLKNPKYMKTWFYRILVNESLTFLRKNKQSLQAVSIEDAFDLTSYTDHYSLDEISIFKEVEKLPEELKTIIILRFYEEMSLKEIAKITSLNLSTVKSRLYKGLRDLKFIINEEEFYE